MAKPAPPLTVLVHPHFGMGYPETRVKPGRVVDARVPEKMREAVGDHPETVSTLRFLRGMHRAYRRDVLRIARTPKAELVIVTSKMHLPSELDVAKARNIPVAHRKKVAQYVEHLQGSLLRFAKSKLGERVSITAIDPDEIGAWVKATRRPPEHNVHVYGEYFEVCVKDAAKSLRKAGFASTRIIKRKSVN